MEPGVKSPDMSPWLGGGLGNAFMGGMGRLGPQAERSSEWVHRPGEVEVPTEREALVVDALADKRIYEQELARMRKENGFLEDQVRRISAELKRYRLRYPNASKRSQAVARSSDESGERSEGADGDPSDESGFRVDDDLPPWVMSSEVMSPLLVAYDARIQDLEGQVTRQKERMEELATRTQQLVEENEQLRQDHIRELDDLVQQAGASGGLGGVGAREMVAELNERINILMAENTVMADQTSAMAKELDVVHHEADEREVQMAALTKALSQAGVGLRELEERVPRLQREKEHVEGELMKAVNSVSERESTLTTVREDLRVVKEEMRCLVAKVSELEADKAVLERQAESDADATTERIQAAGDRITKLQGMLAAKGQEADANGNRARKLQRELDSTRRDAEGMLQVMTGMERQIAEISGREECTTNITRESKKKVEDALLARDQARALEVQSRRELARVLDARKVDAEGHVREVEEAVQAQRGKLLAQLSARDREIQDLVSQAARLKAEAERAARDRAGMEEVYLSLKKGVEGEAESLKARFEELQSRVIQADARRDQREAEARELEHASEDAEREFAAKETSWKARESHLEDTLRARQHELESLRGNLREATNLSESLQRDARRAVAELEEARDDFARKFEDEGLMHKAEVGEAKSQVIVLERASSEAECRVAEMEESFKKQLRDVEERASTRGLQLERRLREEEELAQRTSIRNADLQGRLVQMSSEQGNMVSSARREVEEKARLEKLLAEARRKLSELTAQLSETIGQAESRAREEGRLRAELKRLQITAARETAARGTPGKQSSLLSSQRIRPLSSHGYEARAGGGGRRYRFGGGEAGALSDPTT